MDQIQDIVATEQLHGALKEDYATICMYGAGTGDEHRVHTNHRFRGRMIAGHYVCRICSTMVTEAKVRREICARRDAADMRSLVGAMKKVDIDTVQPRRCEECGYECGKNSRLCIMCFHS